MFLWCKTIVMRILVCIVALPFFLSCKKADTTSPPYSEAVYKVTFTGRWVSPQLGLPATNAHFTPIIGMVHNSSAYMFRPGTLASVGVERVAEDGNAFPLLSEIDSLTVLKKAISSSIYFTPSITGASTFTIYCNSNYPLFSCMSMLAPTPDWFLGVHDVNLQQGSGWISDSTMNVYIYDSGTEQGNVFDQNNPATMPQQPVVLLTPANASVLANGNGSIAPIGTIRFVRQ
jgi:hypothetical protein